MFGCARFIGKALLLQMLGTTILKLQNILRATVHRFGSLAAHAPVAHAMHTQHAKHPDAHPHECTHVRTHESTHARTHARTHASARTFLYHRLRMHVLNWRVPYGLFGVAGS